MSNEEDRHISPGPEKNSRPTCEQSGYGDDAMQMVHTQLMREKEEPREGFSPVPVFFIFLFGALMFFGGVYITRFSGGFRPDVFDPAWAPTKTESAAVAFDPLKQGKKLFARTCQQCHQANGKGVPGVYPVLAGSPWVLGREDRLANLLILGMSGPLVVLDHNYNGNMPTVGMWKDRDIAAVLTYVRQEWGNNAPPVSEATVTEARKSIGTRSKPWSPEEIERLFPL